MDEDRLILVPAAANRALTSAQLGQPEATPLHERTDDRIQELDRTLAALESRLDGVDAALDSVWSKLGE